MEENDLKIRLKNIEAKAIERLKKGKEDCFVKKYFKKNQLKNNGEISK
jgi:hypothetical protein